MGAWPLARVLAASLAMVTLVLPAWSPPRVPPPPASAPQDTPRAPS